MKAVLSQRWPCDAPKK